MKITLIRKKGKNEFINRYTAEEIAYAIQSGWRKHTVTHLREMYHLIQTERQPDGQVKIARAELFA